MHAGRPGGQGHVESIVDQHHAPGPARHVHRARNQLQQHAIGQARLANLHDVHARVDSGGDLALDHLGAARPGPEPAQARDERDEGPPGQGFRNQDPASSASVRWTEDAAGG